MTTQERVLKWVADTPLPTAGEWITTHIPRSIIEDARAAADPEHLVTLALCESGRLWLKPNTPYRFTVMPGCADCAAHAERAEVPDGA